MTPRGGLYGNLHGDGHVANFPVSYDDEVTAEQVAKIDKALAPEFADGDWIAVESETDRK